MPTTELDALTGVPARYRQVLTDDLHLASCRDLVLTERSVIQQAIRAAKKRATLEQIAEWQDDARRYHPTTSDNDPHPWDTTASFAVSFLQRHREDQSLERRIEVEHVDLEPEQPPASQPGWDCHWVCTWMRDRLGLPTTAIAETEPPPTAEPVRPPNTPRQSTRPQLGFDQVTLTDATGTHDLTNPTSAIRTRLPVRLTVTVTGGTAPPDTRLAVHQRLAGRPGRTLHEQALTDATTTIELPDLTPGDHILQLVAWTPTDTNDPARLKLPTLTLDP